MCTHWDAAYGNSKTTLSQAEQCPGQRGVKLSTILGTPDSSPAVSGTKLSNVRDNAESKLSTVRDYAESS